MDSGAAKITEEPTVQGHRGGTRGRFAALAQREGCVCNIMQGCIISSSTYKSDLIRRCRIGLPLSENNICCKMSSGTRDKFSDKLFGKAKKQNFQGKQCGPTHPQVHSLSTTILPPLNVFLGISVFHYTPGSHGKHAPQAAFE